MSTVTRRLWIVLPFLVLAGVTVALTRSFWFQRMWRSAALPWVLLALFWLYLALISRRDRRRTDSGDSAAPPAI